MLGSAPNMVLVAQWFRARPAWAIALADLGTPAGVFLLVPLAQLVVDRWGWRPALGVLAALLVGLVLPANAAQRRPPSEPPTGPLAGAGGVGGALRIPAFWWLGLLRFCAGVGFALVNTHVVALAIDAGVPPFPAAAAVAAVAVVSLAGRLAVGRLTDRLGPAPALTLAFASALAGLGCLGLLTASRQPVWLAAFVACYGLAQGSGGIVSTAAATAAFPGPAVGAITGWIALASGPGEAVGAWAGGALHDRTGGYAPALGFAGAALATGMWAIWRARRKER
jgi:predicted MFS family arabinose efflux permease